MSRFGPTCATAFDAASVWHCAQRRPKELVLDAIEKGRARGSGQMAAGLYSGEDAEDVAAYVAKAVGQTGQGQ